MLVRSRPYPSRFSFGVCLAIIFCLAFGFSAGFLAASFALSENYGSVYDNLLSELENSKMCIERERQQLKTLRQASVIFSSGNSYSSESNVLKKAKEGPSPKVVSKYFDDVFSSASALLHGGEKDKACALLYFLMAPSVLDWSKSEKALIFFKKSCMD